jgi:trans-2-enoyl-CoA reductase
LSIHCHSLPFQFTIRLFGFSIPRMTVLAARVHQFGNPADVLQLDEVERAPPRPNEVVIDLLAAPINPADINIIEGRYGIKPTLPAAIGNEAIGRVVETGSAVTSVSIGDLVRPLHLGCWTHRLVLPADKLAPVPPDLDVDQSAMLTVNPPTAYGMLTDFVDLKTGDWIVQNAANSGVGHCVIQIARRLGFRTLNVVRRPELIPDLESLGADRVVTEDFDFRSGIEGLCNGQCPRLALNTVGGASALNLANALSRDGIHVTYGAMSKQPLKIPNGLLIFRRLDFRGFWLKRWMESLSEPKRAKAFDFLHDMIRDGSLHIPVEASYPLEDVRNAVAHAMREKRGGKILLRMSKG